MISISLVLAVGAPVALAPQHHVTFRSTSKLMPNPERGFYLAGNAYLDDLGTRYFEDAFRQGFRLVYARIDLSPYRAGPLPEAYLKKLAGALDLARRAGIKVIVRPVYNYPAGETEYRSAQDAPLPVVLRHIEQLGRLYVDNEDVIAFVQAGMIGAWGEWHTSSNRLTEPAARLQVRDALLAAVPDDRFIQFRYPPYIMQWTPTLPRLSSALDGTFRTGFHNDCFLASSTDVGTYDEEPAKRAAEREFSSRLGDLAPFGGETCNPADAPGAKARGSCPDILQEGAGFKVTYLNDGYYRRMFHDRWKAEGCLDTVARSLGYRFRLVEVSHPAVIFPGSRPTWNIAIANEGWARLYNPRSMEVVLRNRATGNIERLTAAGSDPRTWQPGRTTDVNVQTRISASMRPGNYEVLLALPDEAVRLRRDPRFSIRFANADVTARGQTWDAKLGAYATGTTIRVLAR